MKRGIWMMAAFVLLIGGVGPAKAEFITFTESSTATGSLGGTTFTDALLTITSTGDTTQLQNPSLGFYAIDSLTANVTVAGVGSGSFTVATYVFSNQSTPGVGIAGLYSDDILDTIKNGRNRRSACR